MPAITKGDWYVGFPAPAPAAGVASVVDVSGTLQNRILISNGTQPFQVFPNANSVIRIVVLSGAALNAVASVLAASFRGEVLAANLIVAAFGARPAPPRSPCPLRWPEQRLAFATALNNSRRFSLFQADGPIT